MTTAIHADELALLDAIHAAPKDTGLHLVYADWLEEHEEPEFAAFIRQHCAAPGGNFGALSDYEKWAPGLPQSYQRFFERGMPMTWLQPNRCTLAALNNVHSRMSLRIGMAMLLHEHNLLHPDVGTEIFRHPIMSRVYEIQVIPWRADRRTESVESILALPLPQRYVQMNFHRVRAEDLDKIRAAFPSYEVTADFTLL